MLGGALRPARRRRRRQGQQRRRRTGGGAPAAPAGRAGHVIDAADAPSRRCPAPTCVIDAAYGTGFRGEYRPPGRGPARPVLAVDIPSGVDGLTGGPPAGRSPPTARSPSRRSSPGLLLADGRRARGRGHLADIGLDASARPPTSSRPTTSRGWLPTRPRAEPQVAGRGVGRRRLAGHDRRRPPDHPGRAAGGAGYVRLSTPGVDDDAGRPTEAVGVPLPRRAGPTTVLERADRFARSPWARGWARRPRPPPRSAGSWTTCPSRSWSTATA